ncbi:tetratricopeptide repeat protein [Sedimentitalea nanhaiensis]|uniref:Flp pilus assembly protein TadD, contains TPR repeats n=1 Tax=Sedimentitalea nanhaiensis TaxID=999627 RepID=A0A1I6XMT2_9RHOB|nr:tetratricopeptide repeat protein [Sedimentitalea nanhaiensis]SFT39261.1 Flp pilus assembly protein TadD, contains TPR repeats [Sedimentitalea nanhaiensis]
MNTSFLRATALAVVAAALLAPAVAQADTAAGAYLAGRQAIIDSNFDSAAEYYARALSRDRDNPRLMENLVLSQLALSRIDKALPVARLMESRGYRSQVAHMVVVADLIATEKYDELLARDVETLGIGPLVDGLVTAWAHVGAGSVAQALAQFDSVAEENGLRAFALYHKALALASVGDFEGAEAIFADETSGVSLLSRGAGVARAQVLSQLQRNQDALDYLHNAFGATLDPGLQALADRLEAGEQLAFDHVTSVRDGMAEVFYSIGQALNGEAADDFVLVYIRTATYLRPNHIDSLLLSAQLLDKLGQYDLAVATYKQISQSSPDYHAAEMGRAEALRRAAKPDAAIEVLEQLAREQPTLAPVHSALGDLLRQQEQYAAAIQAYDRALEYSDPEARARWFLFYARGISHERLKHWERAEADFRSALEINPDQPQVLNYLGYSLVERQIKLDEALAMIEQAVAARPDSGYIVDSLGWVLYRLGRYDEAVDHMETAVELMPVDPVVNDHLGDVYWAVGRLREAEFQWRRALSFIDPEDTDSEADPERIRSKLKVGLDAVLAEEGSPPLKVVNDGG